MRAIIQKKKSKSQKSQNRTRSHLESFFENYFLDEPIVEKYGFKEKVLYLQVKLRKMVENANSLIKI